MAAEDRLIFIIRIWFKNATRNCLNYYTCLFSESWSCAEVLRIPSNVLSCMLAACVSDTLMVWEGFMLLECSNVLFFSCQLQSVIGDLLGHLDVAGKCDIGPVGELLTSGTDKGGCLRYLYAYQMAFHACMWWTTWALIVLHFTGILRFILRGIRKIPVMARCIIKQVSKSKKIFQRIYLVLIRML